MRLQCQILSEEERRRVHDQSVRLLQEVGAKFLSDRALKILSDNGARVDRESRIARIPAEMVDQALKTAPKSFTLGGRDPKRDFALPSPFSGYVLDAGGVFMRDFRTGEKRYATLQDNVDAMRVFEEMSLASVVWPHSVTEVPAHSAVTRLLISSFNATTMHVQDELGDPREVPIVIEILSTILGSEEEVRKRKIYSVCYCTLAPLVHEGEMCDAYLDLIEFEAPILIYPMPCTGATGPCSLYSTSSKGTRRRSRRWSCFRWRVPGRR